MLKPKALFIAVVAAQALLASAQASADVSSTFGGNQYQLERTHTLKDGSTVYLFKDGKMGMENRLGIPARMQEGVAMETRDGQKIIMKGDEVWRVQYLLNRERFITNGGL